MMSEAEYIKVLEGRQETDRKRVERLTIEGMVKDRALVVARSVLEELCAFIWEEHEDNIMREHILRARDQVMNAKLGKLSSDPFPELKSHE